MSDILLNEIETIKNGLSKIKEDNKNSNLLLSSVLDYLASMANESSKTSEYLEKINYIKSIIELIKKDSEKQNLLRITKEDINSIKEDNKNSNLVLSSMLDYLASISTESTKTNENIDKINNFQNEERNNLLEKLNFQQRLNSELIRKLNKIEEKLENINQNSNQDIGSRISKLELKLDLILQKTSQFQNTASVIRQSNNDSRITDSQRILSSQTQVNRYNTSFDVSVYNSDIKEIKSKIDKLKSKFDDIFGTNDIIKWLLDYDYEKDEINNSKISSSSVRAINTNLEKMYLKDELCDFKEFAKTYKNLRKIASSFNQLENSVNNYSSSFKNKLQDFKLELDNIYIVPIVIENIIIKIITNTREKILEAYLNEAECLNKEMENRLKIMCIRPSYGEILNEKLHQILFKDKYDSKIPNNSIFKTMKIGYKDLLTENIIKAKVTVNKV